MAKSGSPSVERRAFVGLALGLGASAVLTGCGGGGDDRAAAPAPAPTAPPRSIESLSPGEWLELPGTALSSIDPSPLPPGATGPASKVIAWTSFAADSRTSSIYSIAGGGHTDYAGNEADCLSLDTTSWGWRRLRAPSLPVRDSAYYEDGRPSSRHHYFGVTIDESGGRVMLFGGARWESGNELMTVDSFNLATNDYSPQGTHPDIPAPVRGQAVKAVCRDPRNDDVYVFANYSVARWQRASNSWTTPMSNGAPFFDDNATAFDTRRNVIHLLVGDGENFEYNVAANSFQARTTSGVNVPQREGMALVYVPAIDAFLVRAGTAGGAVLRIDAATFEVSSFPTTGGSAIPATINGPYNKFLYLPRLQGCAYVPSHGSNIWFLRVH